MSIRKVLFTACLISSALCLAAGYGMAGHWIGAIVAALSGPVWLLAKKYAVPSLIALCLFGSVAVAVTGSLMGSPALLMILGATLGLAAWDLLLLDCALGNKPLAQPTQLFESQHLRSLMLALGAGLLGVLLGRFLTIQIPFLVLVVLVAFLLFALDRMLGDFRKTGL